MSLSYLPELQSVRTSQEARVAAAKRVLQKKYVLDGRMFRQGNGGSNVIRCIFGGFADSWQNYRDPYNHDFSRWESNGIYKLCGVEILGMQPLATGRTFSNRCSWTVPELKAFCKKNGIQVKSSWKKQELLHALMKV